MTKNQKLSLQKIFSLSSITSASGLVKIGRLFYLIADDATDLFQVSLKDQTLKSVLKLQNESLPSDYKERKKVKPDWEALVDLPSSTGLKGILVIPSGSKPDRQRGSLIQGFESGQLNSKPVDFSQVYEKLQRSIPELNMEGGVVVGSKLRLFQRGNGSQAQNAIVDLDLEGVLQDLRDSVALRAIRIQQVQRIEVGKLDGLNLSFTDACEFECFIYFLAVAEDTPSTYEDGLYAGAVLGVMDLTGKVLEVMPLECPEKPEGLWVERENGVVHFYLVTDSDDPSKASSFYQGIISSS